MFVSTMLEHALRVQGRGRRRHAAARYYVRMPEKRKKKKGLCCSRGSKTSGGTPSRSWRLGAPGWLSQGLMEETIEAGGEALLRFGVEGPRTLGLDACLAQAGNEISDRQPLRDGSF